MANAIATAFLNGVLGAHATRVVLSTDTFKLAMIDHGVATPLPASHAFYSSFNAGLIGALSGALATKTVGVVGIGVFDAADFAPAFSAVSGASVESLCLIKDTGVVGTSDFICYWDTATGLPLTPNGGDVNVTFNVSGILKV